ncbi:carboxylesterase family protein [Compostibacter hankyongensis]|uniref:Carboxylesterase type B domain-containing protein n=1 Tax=Compostibacter hankyongensis TaxID=1007089 RepID=A0ABP8FKS4_9BACT
MKKHVFILFSWLLLPATSLTVAAQTTLVRLNDGLIRGSRENNAFVFKGIPYAQPPTGKLRFKPPQPPESWNDTLSCEKFGSPAAQYGESQHPLKGNENCLTLNIYTPKLSANLPVLVWIHGGAMLAGAGMGEDGHAFADRDSIITITINYRLGIFGFLYLDDLDPAYRSSGNNGLLDCIMALKWISKNIRRFGGDPSKVTVMGESAGAKLASTLAVAPEARNYFSQLILESGGLQCIRDTVTAKAIRQRFMEALNIRDPRALLSMPAEKLIAAQGKVCQGAQATNYFGPVIDGQIINDDPYSYLKKHPPSGIRFLIGTNREESRLFMDMDKRLFHPDTTVLQAWFGDNFRYVLSTYRHMPGKDRTAAATATLSQYMYQMHAYRLATQLASTGDHVWMYRFDYRSDGRPATHADELPFVWFLPERHAFTPAALQVGRQVHQAWVHFIRHGTPGAIAGKSWPRYSPASKPVMVLNNASHVIRLDSVFDDPRAPSSCFVIKKPAPLLPSAQHTGWKHLSSVSGDLPVPGKSTQQTALVVHDFDHDGINDFIMGFRQQAPALVWYRRMNGAWKRYVIDSSFLTIEAGGAVYDIDGDGDPDLVLGGDWQSNQLWWWENPFPHYAPSAGWKRHIIKNSGGKQHHDQVWGDFMQTGTPQLAFWNQGSKTLFLTSIPHDATRSPWPLQVVFKGPAGAQNSWYPEGTAAADIDGDGHTDLLAGNYWFKYKGQGKFIPVRFGEAGGRVATGKFMPGKTSQIVVSPGDGSGYLEWYSCTGDPQIPTSWQPHRLIDTPLIHCHSLDVADIDHDGNLDIFAAEMSQWTEDSPVPDQQGHAFIFFGDGKGHFRKTLFSTGFDFHEARLADLDGDGDMDIIDKPYTWKTPRIDIWLQNGTSPPARPKRP